MTLRQRAIFFGDMAKGGYMQCYEIVDGADVVGTKTVYRESYKHEQTTTYFLGEREFATAREFRDAYEAPKEAPS